MWEWAMNRHINTYTEHAHIACIRYRYNVIGNEERPTGRTESG